MDALDNKSRLANVFPIFSLHGRLLKWTHLNLIDIYPLVLLFHLLVRYSHGVHSGHLDQAASVLRLIVSWLKLHIT